MSKYDIIHKNAIQHLNIYQYYNEIDKQLFTQDEAEAFLLVSIKKLQNTENSLDIIDVQKLLYIESIYKDTYLQKTINELKNIIIKNYLYKQLNFKRFE